MLKTYIMCLLSVLEIFGGAANWYRNAVFYQVYPRSFKDSNNDGTGDLQGVYEKLDYLKYTGVTVVWMSPIFKSPQVDHGYDISDYYTIDPQYGDLGDLVRLLDRVKELEMKIMLDLVPNHTSDRHQWFQNSVNNVSGYADYYVWVDAKIDKNGRRIPPNNWLSVFSKSAWSWNEKRQKYHLHQFDPCQPDLNLRNPKVIEEFKRILGFYFDLGVDGFRIDAAPYLIEDMELRDEPLLNSTNGDPDCWDNLDHIYTKDTNETYEWLYDLRLFIDQYNLRSGGNERIIVTEAYTFFEKTILYFGSEDGSKLGAHFTFNFEFVLLKINVTANDIKEIVERWSNRLNKNYCINWGLGNHDNHRTATRLGNVDGFNMLILFLPGTAATYYGEEIGQEDGEVNCEEGTDPKAIQNCITYALISRDYEITPFQWDTTVNAGFNDGAKPWLPISESYRTTNLAAQNVPGLRSHYNTYRDMVKLRKELEAYDHMHIDNFSVSDNVLHITRLTRSMNNDSYVFLFNMERSRTRIVFLGNRLYQLLISSVNSQYSDGRVFKRYIFLLPQESVVLKEFP